ncbi:arginyl-tRNA synthetase [Tieghemostelium lacteum]|uniref:arginine--tRNA ligase n=1 Tax=Tieghemostelium lacteum TaxID=361077 RepID=A0A152A784_TIELA|nr:arginyl-tRNA synthetase [Tieghemostelium lacteum]|eukprot:KYR02089.1 arginyl-tRNA synthetase [Tieghemostelium lacteum]
MSKSVFENEIAKQVGSILEMDTAKILDCIEVPKNKDLADFALPVPRLNKFKPLGNPQEAIKKIQAAFVLNDTIKEITVAGTYLNFKVNHTLQIKAILDQIIAQKENYGKTTQGQGRNIIVEFSSPNIAKPFHAGHLRSTMVGNFMCNLYKATGYNPVAINYLGDWGKQYGVLAVGFAKYGSEEALVADPIKHLFDVYVKINKDIENESKPDEDPNEVKAETSTTTTTTTTTETPVTTEEKPKEETKKEKKKREFKSKEEGGKPKKPSATDEEARQYFKKMESGDKDALALWQRFRDLSIEKYKQIYQRLNIHFDVYSGESQMGGLMEKQYQILESKGLVKESKGAMIIELEKEGKVLVKKNDGTSLYITRDIAAAATRKEKYDFEKMYYCVASQQDLHFRQLFTILRDMGYAWAKDLTHINYGMVLGMSTRKGTVVFLEDILNKTKSKMLKIMKATPEKFSEIEDPEKVADIIGISAVVIQDFAARRIKDYEFNWNRMLSADGDTGVYLQYAHARLSSLERKSGATFNPEADLSLLVEPVAHKMATILGRYPEVIQKTLTELEATVLVTYLFELSHTVSQAHSILWIKGQEKPIADARYVLYWAAKQVLSSGLKILGLTPLDRM